MLSSNIAYRMCSVFMALCDLGPNYFCNLIIYLGLHDLLLTLLPLAWTLPCSDGQETGTHSQSMIQGRGCPQSSYSRCLLKDCATPTEKIRSNTCIGHTLKPLHLFLTSQNLAQFPPPSNNCACAVSSQCFLQPVYSYSICRLYLSLY